MEISGSIFLSFHFLSLQPTFRINIISPVTLPKHWSPIDWEMHRERLRSGASMFCFSNNLIILGGFTFDVHGENSFEFNTRHQTALIFNLGTHTWKSKVPIGTKQDLHHLFKENCKSKSPFPCTEHNHQNFTDQHGAPIRKFTAAASFVETEREDQIMIRLLGGTTLADKQMVPFLVVNHDVATNKKLKHVVLVSSLL